MTENSPGIQETQEQELRSEEDIQNEKLKEAEVLLSNVVSEILPHISRGTDLSTQLREMLKSEPWYYAYNQRGAIVVLVDIALLEEAVATVPESKKEGVLIHLQRLIGHIEQEKIEAAQRYLEGLKEPDLELLERFSAAIESINSSLIEEVSQITTAEAAFSSEKRIELKKIKDELDEQITALWRDTKIEIDDAHTEYPQFWPAQAKLNKIRNAVGAVNGGVLRHNLEKDV